MLLLFSPKAKFMEKNRFQKLSKIVKFEVLDKNAQIRIIFEFKIFWNYDPWIPHKKWHGKLWLIVENDLKNRSKSTKTKFVKIHEKCDFSCFFMYFYEFCFSRFRAIFKVIFDNRPQFSMPFFM
jgi:hypothetical protein